MNTLPKIILFCAALALVPATAAAQKSTLGELEYNENCAVCHGADGSGNGPYAGMLTKKPSDLTMLRKNNNGVFPVDNTYSVIDGRFAVDVHGSRDMPVWGIRYNAKANRYYTDYYDTYHPEAFVRGRILALISYLNDIQKM